MMIISSAMSIIIVKVYKCMKQKKEGKDITPIADLEKEKTISKTKGIVDDEVASASAYASKTTVTEMS
jgi:hypothetical protein